MSWLEEWERGVCRDKRKMFSVLDKLTEDGEADVVTKESRDLVGRLGSWGRGILRDVGRGLGDVGCRARGRCSLPWVNDLPRPASSAG